MAWVREDLRARSFHSTSFAELLFEIALQGSLVPVFDIAVREQYKAATACGRRLIDQHFPAATGPHIWQEAVEAAAAELPEFGLDAGDQRPGRGLAFVVLRIGPDRPLELA